MLRTLELLNKSPVIRSFEILDFKQGSDFYYLKCNAILVDESELHVKEYVSMTDFTYSYHWQDAHGNLIIRWDNALHNPSIQTHPHHKHTPSVEESQINNLDGALNEIEAILNTRK